MNTNYVDNIIFFLTNLLIYTKYRRLIITYLFVFRRFPNIAKPTKLSEMVQWRKVFDKNPIFCIFADKLLVKKWVHEKILNLNIPKTIWVGVGPEKIPEQYLKNGFVLKTNHGSGQNYFPCRERRSRDDVERIFREWLSIDWSKHSSEWAYSSVKRTIFVEELIGDKNNSFDIAVRAHNGAISLASVAIDFKTENRQYGYFLPDGSRYDDEFDFLSVPKKEKLSGDFVLPVPFFEALDAARILSRGLDYVRVDFLASGNNLFFSEMTVFPASGLSSDGPYAEIIFQNWIKNIDQSWFFNSRHSRLRSIYQAAAMRHFRSLR